MQNRSIQWIGTLLGMDTRLMEIGLGGYAVISGFSVLSSRYKNQFSPLPYLEPVLKAFSLGDWANVAWGLILICSGIFVLWSVAQGMIKNNHYTVRSISMLHISLLWTGMSIGMLCSSTPTPDAGRYIWGAALAWGCALLLALNSEAVRDGCASFHGALCSVSPPSNRTSNMKHGGVSPPKAT